MLQRRCYSRSWDVSVSNLLGWADRLATYIVRWIQTTNHVVVEVDFDLRQLCSCEVIRVVGGPDRSCPIQSQ